MFMHKKLANMSKFFLIILIGIPECWEALFFYNLSMSFFMSSVLTSEKLNVSSSQLLSIASILRRSKDSFKSWIYYVFCNRIKLTVYQNIQILYYIGKETF